MNKTIAKRARFLRLNARLDKQFWAKVVSMTCYLINRSPRVNLDGNVTEEVWTNKEISRNTPTSSSRPMKTKPIFVTKMPFIP